MDGCVRCGLPLPPIEQPLGEAEPICTACSDRRMAPTLVACVVYDGFARALLLHGKQTGRRELLDDIGRQVAARVAAQWPRSQAFLPFDRIVAVPSHPLTNLRRGFAPANQIARQIASRLGCPLDRWTLRRPLNSPRAVKGLDRRSRRGAGAKLFLTFRRIVGARVLLVDDVVTTGTSLEFAAKSLLEAGAESVTAAAWAVHPGFNYYN